MAKTYLDSGDTFIVANNNSTVFGAAGTESVTIQAGVTGTVLDQNTESVLFNGAVSAFTFQQTGNQINVYSGATLVAKFPVQGDANGTLLTFTDGTVSAKLTAGVLQFGGTAVSSTAPAAVVPTTIDTSVVTPGGVVVPPTPTFSVTGAAAVAEGASATFTVTLSAAQATATTVAYTLAGTGGAVLGTDTGVNAPAGNTGTLTFAAGETTKTVVVPITADAMGPEAGEGVSLTLSAPSTGTVVSTTAAAATTAITDVPVTYTLTASAASVYEGVGITYTLTASAASTTATSIDFSVTPGDALAVNQGTSNTNLNDFAAGAFNPANVVLAAGATTATYTVTSSNDAITELPENYSVKAVIGTTTVATATTSLLDGTSAGGQTFTLTTGTDTFTGGAGNDTFNSAPGVVIDPSNGTQSVVDSLQVVDKLDGGAGTDTLNVTFAQATTNVAPTLTAIENINATFNAAGAKLDLAGATGVQKVTVTGSAQAAVVNSVGAIATLAVANQSKNVSFDGSTATTLGLSFDTVGKVDATTPVEVAVDIGAAAASKATTLNITTNNSNVEVKDTTGANVATTATIAATGVSEVKLTDGLALTGLTVTGAGSVDVSEVGLVKVATLTAGDGGVTFNTGNSTATTFSATTGAGKDTLTVDGDNVKTISTGAGDDKVTTATAALVATASINLGAGNDTLTLHAAPAAAGATLTGGEGTDTLATIYAAYNTIAAYGATDLAKITGFETLSITTAALANTNNVDLSKLAGLTSAQILGVATGGAATISGVGANASVVINGDINTDTGTLTVTLKDATGSSDVLNLTLNDLYTENNDATATVEATNAFGVTASGVETLNVTSTGTASTKFLGATGNKADGVLNTLTLTDDALVTLNASGDQGIKFASAAAQVKLATVDASANTAGANIDVSLAKTDGTAAAITVKGSATAANTLKGSGNADTIVGGSKTDLITGGAKGDTLTGNGGNDKFVFAAGDSAIGTGTFDTITDFVANTWGNGTSGAAGTEADLADATKVTGDVLSFTAVGATVAQANGFKVFVASSAADATTFLANGASADNTSAYAALDSTTNKLYVDVSGDGVTDFYISLTGVTSITAAAFELL